MSSFVAKFVTSVLVLVVEKNESQREVGKPSSQVNKPEAEAVVEAEAGRDEIAPMATRAEKERREEESYMEKLRLLGIPDIDQDDCDDPLAVTEYVKDVLTHLKRTEVEILFNTSFLS